MTNDDLAELIGNVVKLERATLVDDATALERVAGSATALDRAVVRSLSAGWRALRLLASRRLWTDALSCLATYAASCAAILVTLQLAGTTYAPAVVAVVVGAGAQALRARSRRGPRRLPEASVVLTAPRDATS